MGTSSGWTDERRIRQFERIRRVKPWAKSTGPRTTEGKHISSQNARKYPEVIASDFDVMMKVAAASTRLPLGWTASQYLLGVDGSITEEEALEISRRILADEYDEPAFLKDSEKGS